jgi:hypothetical protein
MVIDDLKSQISDFLKAGKWDAFFEWFALMPIAIEGSEDDAVAFVHAVHRDLVDFDEGFLSEANLRENLTAKLRGFGSYFVTRMPATAGAVTTDTTSSIPAPVESVWLCAGAGRASAL